MGKGFRIRNGSLSQDSVPAALTLYRASGVSKIGTFTGVANEPACWSTAWRLRGCEASRFLEGLCSLNPIDPQP